MQKTLDQSLSEETLKKYKEIIEQTVSYVSNDPLDREEYIKSVGYIQGMRTAESIFSELHKMYFPST